MNATEARFTFTAVEGHRVRNTLSPITTGVQITGSGSRVIHVTVLTTIPRGKGYVDYFDFPFKSNPNSKKLFIPFKKVT